MDTTQLLCLYARALGRGSAILDYIERKLRDESLSDLNSMRGYLMDAIARFRKDEEATRG